jgi:ABC-type polysaccharide/polyol phosphate export permease
MKKVKDFVMGLISSHIFWALVSFIMIMIFTGMSQNETSWTWKSTASIVSSVFFVLFGLGAVGLSIFNLIIRLVKKLIEKIKKK